MIRFTDRKNNYLIEDKNDNRDTLIYSKYIHRHPNIKIKNQQKN